MKSLAKKFKRKVGKLVSSEKEDIEIKYYQAQQLFDNKKSYEIEKAQSRQEELIKTSEELISKLDKELEQVKSYDDNKDLNVIDDVKENIYNSRKKIIKEYSSSESIIKHNNELKTFLTDFNDASAKEKAVMKRIQKKSETRLSLEKLNKHSQDVQEFINTGYKPVEKSRKISKLSENIEDLLENAEEERKHIENKKNEISEIEENLNSLNTKISKITEGQEWKRKEELENESKKLENEKANLEKSLSKKASKLDRGLKKLIYNIENQSLTFKGDLENLKNLRKEKFEQIDDIGSDLQNAEEKLETEEILTQRQLEKFEQTSKSLYDLDKKTSEIKRLRKQINENQEKLKNMEVVKQRENVQKKKKEVKTDLEDQKDLLEKKKKELDNTENEISEKIRSLEEVLNSSLNTNISINSSN